MQDRHVPGKLLALVVSWIIASAGFGAAPRALAQGANLLQNPGFEGAYTPFNGDTTRNLAASWSPWNLPPGPGDPSYVNATPEYRLAANPLRIHSQSSAQEYFTFYATHTGGIFQRAQVGAGNQVQFSAFINVWSTSNDNPNRSDNPGEVKLQVGIDPNGGIDATAAGIVWSAETEYYDQYRQLSITATASADFVTVFVRSAPRQPVKNNHVYVDDAQLSITTLAATRTPLPSVTPAPPSATFAPPPSPTREGTIPPSDTPGGATVTPLPTFTPEVLVTETPGGSTETPSATPFDFTPAPTITPGGPTLTSTPVVFPYHITIVVVYGDTVYDLAIRYNSTIDAIIAANSLNEEALIFVGQSLIIPVPTPPTTPTAIVPTLAPYVTPTSPGLYGPTLNGIGTYIVQPGDDLFRISVLYNITPGALARLNGIVNANQIRVGQVLVVPGPGNNIGGRPPVQPPPPSRRTYVVQVGDNLYRISLRFNVTLDALMRANGIINPNYVYVGQTLYIP